MFNTVLTLICNPATPQLDSAFAARLLLHLNHVDFAGQPKRQILKNGIAEDYLLHLEAAHYEDLNKEVTAFLAGAPIDFVIQPLAGREKRLLIADMDSTIIEQECIDELAEFAGLRAEISEITERAMQGELDFDGALKARVAMLKGLPVAVLEETFTKKITLTPGARTLVQTMNARGAVTALVSGGFTYFTSRVARAVGFQTNQANELLVEDGKLTGCVGEPILGKQAKLDALNHLLEFNNLAANAAIAVGDGANDLAMLGRAGLGVAFRAKPAVAAATDAQINHGDLTTLLYLQGIPEDDFAVGS